MGRSTNADAIGYAETCHTPESIRNLCERIGVAKRESIVDMALLEYCIREDLNQRAPRVMGVLRPLRVVIDNYPEDQVEELEAPAQRSQEEAGAWSFKPENLFRIVDELDRIAMERNVSIPQVALNYVLQKPGICSIIIAVRNSPQMEENLKTMEWQITPEEITRLDKVSDPEHMYPYDIPDPNSKI